MRQHILLLLFFPVLLLSLTPAAEAAGKSRAQAKTADSEELPAMKWGLISTGFLEVFKLRNREIESAEPNRFFQGTVAFALGRMDETGHYLMLNCGSGATCSTKRDMLEDRLVFATLLEVVRTPKVTKDQLYNARTWEVSSLGEQYLEKLRKRYPDLSARLGKLVMASFANQ